MSELSLSMTCIPACPEHPGVMRVRDGGAWQCGQCYVPLVAAEPGPGAWPSGEDDLSWLPAPVPDPAPVEMAAPDGDEDLAAEDLAAEDLAAEDLAAEDEPVPDSGDEDEPPVEDEPEARWTLLPAPALIDPEPLDEP